MKIYECYFDGSCGPDNPNGRMGAGVHITSGADAYSNSFMYPAKYGNTNNVAEYLALIHILKLMKKKTGCVIKILGDSKLVIMQMDGQWRIKDGAYVPFAREAQSLLTELRKNNTVMLQWIPRDKNQTADDLSKKCVL